MMSTSKTLLLLVSAVYLCSGQNNFMTAVKNLNDDKNVTKDGDNALKNDFVKYVKECRSGEDSAEEEDDSGEGKESKGDGHGGTYPKSYGDSKYRNTQQGDLSTPYHRNYSRNNQRNGNFDERRGDQNNDWLNRQVENHNINYGYRPIKNQYDYNRSMGEENFSTPPMMTEYDRYPNYEFYGAFPRPYGTADGVHTRTKRGDDVNCANQCAFGYLDVLDDNRVPSETAVIKYLQDHVPNDRKRIQYLREARRCFAQLATTDNEDGCGFSKMLAKCLKLETE